MLSWLQDRLRDYFGFSKAEANGTLVLLLLTTICLIVPQSLHWYYSTQPVASHDQDIALLERTLAMLEVQKQTPKPSPVKPPSNTYSLQQLQPFDINTADATQLSTIKGIGAVLAARIVKFRDKLGGFVSQVQYQEVYGLRPAVIQRLQKHTYISTDFRPALLNINTADVQTLAAHPYLTYQQARSIVRYREQHGSLSSVNALSALMLMDKTTLEKVKAYLIAR